MSPVLPAGYSGTELKNPFNAAPVYYSEETGSTMADAELLLDQHPESGSVVCCGYQSSGVGRKEGRNWNSEPGSSMMFTLILGQDSVAAALHLVPLLTGLGLACFLEEKYSLFPEIKWPNDLIVKGRKIAGILCRLKKGYFLIGMGLNCNQAQFDIDAAFPPTSLFLEKGITSLPAQLVPEVLEKIRYAFGLGSWKREIENRLAFKGEEVTVTGPGSEPWKGSVDGLDGDGRLLITARNGMMVSLLTEEISLRNPGTDDFFNCVPESV